MRSWSKVLLGTVLVLGWPAVASAAEPEPSAELTVGVSSTPLIAGAEGSYSVVVGNNGPMTAREVVLTDTLPSGLSLLGATTPNGTCKTRGPDLSCSLGDLPVDASASVTIQFKVAADASGPKVNKVEATSPSDPDGAIGIVSRDVGRGADLSTKVHAGVKQAVPGGQFDYAVVVENAGPGIAENVVLTDELPEGLTVLSAKIRGGEPCQVDGRKVVCSLGDQRAGKQTVDLTVKLAAGYPKSTLVNSATVSSDTPELKPGDETGTARTPVVGSADVSVKMTARGDKHVAGDSLIYDLDITNDGPSDAVGVSIADLLPDELEADNVEGPDGTECNLDEDNYLHCSLGTIPAGKSVRLVLHTFIADDFSGPLASIVGVGAETDDPNLTNNHSRVDTVVGAATTPKPPVTPPTATPSSPSTKPSAVQPGKPSSSAVQPGKPSNPASVRPGGPRTTTPVPVRLSGQQLGETGAPLNPFLLVGVLTLILAGGILITVTRRRRTGTS
jgi:uncharacterized repeat protein (TIGR01451 family)